ALRSTTDRNIQARTTLTQEFGSAWDALPQGGAGHLISAAQGNRLWSPTGATRASEVSRATEAASSIPAELTELSRDAGQLAKIFGIRDDGLTPQRSSDLHQLAALASSQARPLPEWLNPSLSATLSESAQV